MVTKKYVVLTLILSFALVVAACAARGAPVPQVVKESPYTGAGREGVEELLPAPAPAGDKGLVKASEERMLVRTAQLSLVVKDPEESLAQIKSIIEALDGYVADTRMWRDEEQMRGSVTVRVPAESLDDALTELKALAVRVESESGSSQDVTEEYTDLSARLRNLEATEQELLELLKTVREKTGKAEDVLAVHRELTNIRGQIEQLKGRMQYLERTSAMAAVTIELIPDVLTRPIAVGTWQPSATLAGALRALLHALRFIADAAIWIVFYILPVAIILLIPFGIVWLIWRRRRKEKPVAKA